jgi:hypothetical protein
MAVNHSGSARVSQEQDSSQKVTLNLAIMRPDRRIGASAVWDLVAPQDAPISRFCSGSALPAARQPSPAATPGLAGQAGRGRCRAGPASVRSVHDYLHWLTDRISSGLTGQQEPDVTGGGPVRRRLPAREQPATTARPGTIRSPCTPRRGISARCGASASGRRRRSSGRWPLCPATRTSPGAGRLSAARPSARR